MWLKRLVGIVMILTCLGMLSVVIVGVFSPDKPANVGFVGTPSSPATPVSPPNVTITADPESITIGGFSGLTWTSTGNPDNCSASGDWTGSRTPNGSESTGRISAVGDKNYTITCSNAGGNAQASVTVKVAAANAPVAASGSQKSTSNSSPSSAATYCSGRIPCYGAREVGTHASTGNCWGWNGDRVINISGFDLGFHIAKTGISSIQISQVCGHDLAPALSGEVSAGGQTRDHNATTKANADSSEFPYFVGYFDKSKP